MSTVLGVGRLTFHAPPAAPPSVPTGLLPPNTFIYDTWYWDGEWKQEAPGPFHFTGKTQNARTYGLTPPGVYPAKFSSVMPFNRPPGPLVGRIEIWSYGEAPDDSHYWGLNWTRPNTGTGTLKNFSASGPFAGVLSWPKSNWAFKMTY